MVLFCYTYIGNTGDAQQELSDTQCGSEKQLPLLQVVELIDEGARQRLEHGDLQQGTRMSVMYNNSEQPSHWLNAVAQI